MDRPIARRDFLNGAAIAIGFALAGPAFGESGEPQDQPGYYPPALTGMRGSHPGSFEAAHRLRDGAPLPSAAPDAANERYDLVIVGGGISGLAAAAFYRAQKPQGRVRSTTTMISATTPSATNFLSAAGPSSSTGGRGRSTVRGHRASSPPRFFGSSASIRSRSRSAAPSGISTPRSDLSAGCSSTARPSAPTGWSSVQAPAVGPAPARHPALAGDQGRPRQDLRGEAQLPARPSGCGRDRPRASPMSWVGLSSKQITGRFGSGCSA